MTELETTARALVAEGKGILAADESDGTIKKRFDSIGVESTEDTRRAYRELLFATDGIEEFISGAIMYDEIIRQRSFGGPPLAQVFGKPWHCSRHQGGHWGQTVGWLARRNGDRGTRWASGLHRRVP